MARVHPFIHKLGGTLAADFVYRWMRTLECQYACYDPSVDVVHPDFSGSKLYLFWHEYIPFSFFLRPHSGLTVLLSRHQDAEVLSKAAQLMGYGTIRGSTNRGGVTALRELVRRAGSDSLCMTPDGPRGPRRKLSPGPIYLASRMQLPIVLLGFGYDRPWRNPYSWDRFAVPRPYSRGRAIFSPPIHLPADLDRGAIEEARVHVENLLNFCTTEAERWAEQGGRIEGQRPLRSETTPIWQRAARAA